MVDQSACASCMRLVCSIGSGVCSADAKCSHDHSMPAIISCMSVLTILFVNYNLKAHQLSLNVDLDAQARCFKAVRDLQARALSAVAFVAWLFHARTTGEGTCLSQVYRRQVHRRQVMTCLTYVMHYSALAGQSLSRRQHSTT